MDIVFIPEDNLPELITASEEYTTIWQKSALKITQALEELTGLTFKQDVIKATVFEGVSQSDPLKLRASYSKETKIATLIHELGHILLTDNNIKPKNLSSHKILFLFLYDVWCRLYGKKFADRQVLVEKKRANKYNEDWDWFFTKSEYEKKQLLHGALR